MPNSVKSNFIFNLINSGSQLLFPLVTFPYASRIMMADGIGQVSFFSSIISYISLFTCLGIPMYAIREVATVRGDRKKMTNTTIEILLLHAFLTIIGYIAVAVICMTVDKVQTDIPLFLILSSTVFFTAIGCEWFYQGVEDFKYVAIRGMVIKVISVVLLFVLVRTKEDILWYGAYTVFGILGGNLFNFFRLRKYLNKGLIDWHELRPFRHFKPVLHIFVFNVVVSVYLQLNTVLLGFLKDAKAVGYFTTATKILGMTMSISSSLGSVILPHASNLIAEKKMEEFKVLVQKSYDFIIAITFPLMTGLIFTSKSAVLLLAGSGFVPSITASQIVAPIIVLVGISNVLGLQILYPMGQINKVIWCTLLGAIVNVVLNCLLIPYLAQNGTAIAYLTAEFAVTFSMFFIGHKYICLSYIKRQHFNYITGSFIMAVCLYFITRLELGNATTLLLMIFCGILIYITVLFALKDKLSLQIISILKNKF